MKRNFAMFPLLACGLLFAAADASATGSAPASASSSTPLFFRKSDQKTFNAACYADEATLLKGMSRGKKLGSAPYVLNKDGTKQNVEVGDYVVTEQDGEHYFVVTAEEFAVDYEPLQPVGVAGELAATAPAPESTQVAASPNQTTATSPVSAENVTEVPKGGEVPEGKVPSSAITETNDRSLTGSPVTAEPGVPTLADVNNPKDRLIEELKGANNMASQAFQSLDDYLHSINPDLPEHYGMPVDGVRQTVEYVKAQAELATESGQSVEGLAVIKGGIHTPFSPDTPTAAEGAAAVSYILEHFPKLAGSILDTAKHLCDADFIKPDVRAKLVESIGTAEKRFKYIN